VTRYTLSFLDDRGQALRSELLDCTTDAEAINALNDNAGNLRVELWLEDQKILELPGDTRPRRPHACHGRRNSPRGAGSGNLAAGA
jgi:hypothetical protein